MRLGQKNLTKRAGGTGVARQGLVEPVIFVRRVRHIKASCYLKSSKQRSGTQIMIESIIVLVEVAAALRITFVDLIIVSLMENK